MASKPAAGWFRDPQQDGMLRYWDGNAWTEHTSPVRSGGGAASLTVGEPPKSSRKRLFVVATAVVLAAAVGAFALLGGDGGDESTQAAVPSPRGTEAAEDGTDDANVDEPSSTTTTAATTKTEARVTVPDVVGTGASEAGSALEAAGLAASSRTESVADESQWGRVIGQEPGPGQKVAPGVEVVLVVGSRPAECNDVMEATPNAGFVDVDASGDPAAAAAVDWAAAAGLVQGTAPTRFSPEVGLNRGQMITILWRYFCEPEAPASGAFPDVAGTYFEPAVHWATDRGVISPAAEYRGDEPATRGQFFTVVWRAVGSPESSGLPPADVAPDAFYRSPAAWAAENGLASAEAFAGDVPLTRLDAVVLLYLIETTVNPFVS